MSESNIENEPGYADEECLYACGWKFKAACILFAGAVIYGTLEYTGILTILSILSFF